MRSRRFKILLAAFLGVVVVVAVGLGIAVYDVVRDGWHRVAIPFEIHDGYFVSNDFVSSGFKYECGKWPPPCSVIKSQEHFDAVFGTAAVMQDESHRLPEDAFQSKMVLAVIKHDGAIWQFKVEDVTEKDGFLRVRYTATSMKSDSATFACPLIISVPKLDYKWILLEENGIAVHRNWYIIHFRSWDSIDLWLPLGRVPGLIEDRKSLNKAEAELVIASVKNDMLPAAYVTYCKADGLGKEDEIRQWLVSQGITNVSFRCLTNN